ncbi:MAG: ABC transporter ATP-binding protein, partial [Planctomycetota bacterium]
AAAHKTERSSPPDQAPVIVVENATRRFGSFTAVHEASFTVHKGEIFGLLGANGAGKTTTFRMLCGLLPATSGSLHVAGVNMRRAPARAKARIGYMSQRFSLYRELTTQDNLRFFAGAYGLRGRRRHERIEWAIHEFDLASVLHVVSANLPHGFQQRLAFACALMHEPDVLFLDEPTSGVDLLARREFWRRISSLAQQGVTVLVTTHFMEEAEQCDRIVIMRAGRILAAGAPDEIRVRAGRGAAPAASLEDAFLAILEHTEASPQPSTS